MFFSSSTLSNVNVIRPLPRFYTLRFGRRLVLNDDEEEKIVDYKIKEINRPTAIPVREDQGTSILITSIRDRDWRFFDDHQQIDPTTISKMEYRRIPLMNNTMKNRLIDLNIEQNGNQYEEYDFDEQDLHWLIAYNQFRQENHRSELDENVFEYVMQILEHQCLLAIRQKNYEDTIECDACHRLDDVDDLIQCVQCQMIVHQKCYGVKDHSNEWRCDSCLDHQQIHRCCMCEKIGGALKHFHLISNEFQVEKWIHLSCAFWIPQFEFDEQMNPILKENLQYDGQCSGCNQSIGYKLTCSWRKCQERFHVQCAIENQYDLFVAENDEKTSVHLLALCHRHKEKINQAEKRIRINQAIEIKRKRFERFPSYIDLNAIENQTLIPSDVLQSIYTYWILKRQANHNRPLIDLPEEMFYRDYNRQVNWIEYTRQYHLDHQDPMTEFIDDKSNVLSFLSTHRMQSSSTNESLFVKYARRNRMTLNNYERDQFCLLDGEKRKK